LYGLENDLQGCLQDGIPGMEYKAPYSSGFQHNTRKIPLVLVSVSFIQPPGQLVMQGLQEIIFG
jgi:hypothetical protein